MKTPIRVLTSGETEVKVATMFIDHFFDPLDFTYLSILLKEKTEAIGLETEFNCPVRVKIYFPVSTSLNDNQLTEQLQSKSIEAEVGGKNKSIETGYKVVNKIEYSTITTNEYLQRMFQPYISDFNDKSKYS